MENIKAPLSPGAVGILGSGEAPRGQAQLLTHIGCHAEGHLPVELFLGESVCFAVGQHQQGIVIEHFFKVGDEELPVGGVAGEAAPHMVEDAPAEQLF